MSLSPALRPQALPRRSREAKAVFNMNVIALLCTTPAVMPAVRKQREGLIVNIGSSPIQLRLPTLRRF
jgi:short-subunit dehydrogenase